MPAYLDIHAVARVRQLFAASPRFWIAALAVTCAATYAVTLFNFGFDATALATVAAVALAACLSGIAGFAFSAICGAMLFQFRSDTVDVVQIMLVCSIANQMLSVWALRREIRYGALKPFLAGGVFGVTVGVWILLTLDARAYAIGLGAVLAVYGSYMLFRKPIVLAHSPVIGDIAAGFTGGLMGGFAATPGAAVSVWCGMKGWDKVAQRAVFQPYILVMQVFALTLLAAAHHHGASSVGFPPLALVCVPAGLAGTWCGLGCFRYLSDRMFRMAINLLLIASGAGLAL